MCLEDIVDVHRAVRGQTVGTNAAVMELILTLTFSEDDATSCFKLSKFPVQTQQPQRFVLSVRGGAVFLGKSSWCHMAI